MISKEIIRKIENEAKQRYGGRFDNLGVSVRTLGWGCKEDQMQRFDKIVECCELEGKTVMDVGCGFADFYGYIQDRGIRVNYIGVDIIPQFIEYCRAQYKDQSFYCANFMLDSDLLPEADIIISLGTLNYNLRPIDNYEYSKLFITTAFSKANERVVVDFLSTNITPGYQKEDFVFYHSPAEMLEFSMSLTSNCALIHNYPPIPQKEFMIILDR
jgi:SAM-dependent methyltransferase